MKINSLAYQNNQISKPVQRQQNQGFGHLRFRNEPAMHFLSFERHDIPELILKHWDRFQKAAEGYRVSFTPVSAVEKLDKQGKKYADFTEFVPAHDLMDPQNGAIEVSVHWVPFEDTKHPLKRLVNKVLKRESLKDKFWKTDRVNTYFDGKLTNEETVVNNILKKIEFLKSVIHHNKHHKNCERLMKLCHFVDEKILEKLPEKYIPNMGYVKTLTAPPQSPIKIEEIAKKNPTESTLIFGGNSKSKQ